MPVLVLLNGPAGIGKSTLARRYVEDHPLSLNLDVDRVRDLLGRWADDPERAGLQARALALAMARTHLSVGGDVIVPQLVARLPFVLALEQAAAETGASFAEVVLMDTRPNAARRFAERGRTSARPEHRDARDQAERSGGAAAVEALYDRLVAMVADRPGARIVTSTEGDPDRTYRQLLAVLH